MSKKIEKDPFEEYDKFWDELDKAEEIKNDEDYFKDKKINSFNELNHTDRDKKYQKQVTERLIFGTLAIFFFGFFMMFIMMSRNSSWIFFNTFQSIILFIFFMVIIINVINKLKHK